MSTEDEDIGSRRSDPESWLETAEADDIAQFIEDGSDVGVDLDLMEAILINAFRRIARLERANGLDLVELPPIRRPEGGDR